MSGSTSTVTVAAAGDGFRPPFTAVQWQELEQQALIYKYLMAGLPVPPDLVLPIRRSLEALSARFFHHPTLGYCSYYGKKFDPEPGRCRRTDGKKWRCAKDAYPDSKYCERHMHRGRNRSRKPVESQSTSQSLSTAISHIANASSNAGESFPNSGSGSFQNLPLYPVVNSENLSYGGSASKLQMEASSCDINNNKEYKYMQGLTLDADGHNFSPEASGSARVLGMDSNIDTTWHLKPRNDSPPQENSTQRYLPEAYATISKQRQQHCFFGNDMGSVGPLKQEQHSMRPFFNQWPKTRQSWSDMDGDRCNKNALSTTQLSISIPRAPSEYASRSACSPDDA